jgi:hypothetical protein
VTVFKAIQKKFVLEVFLRPAATASGTMKTGYPLADQLISGWCGGFLVLSVLA